MTIHGHWSTGVVCGMALIACTASAQSISTDYDHGASFAQYHTFSVYKVQTSDPFFDQRIKDQVVKDLTAKGLQPVDTGGDVAVTAVETTKNKQEYNTFYDGLGGAGFGWRGWRGGWGGGLGGDSTTTVNSVPVGTLMIDVYDNKSHQLVWRGSSRQDLSSKAAKNTSKLDKAVDKMFDKYPPK